MSSFLLHLFARLLSVVPNWGLQFFCNSLAILCFDIFRLRRRVALDHIALAFPEESPKQRRQWARQSYTCFVQNIIELLLYDYRDLTEDITFSGDLELKVHLANRRPVILLCGHIGNWEVNGAGITRYIKRVPVVVKKVGNIHEFVTKMRQKIGLVAIEKDASTIKNILRALKEDRFLAIVMDQYRPGDLKVPYFGQSVPTNTTLARITLKTNAIVVPTFCRRKRLFQHEISFLPPLNIEGLEDQSLFQVTALANAELEAIIRKNPDQYPMWVHRRFKNF